MENNIFYIRFIFFIITSLTLNYYSYGNSNDTTKMYLNKGNIQFKVNKNSLIHNQNKFLVRLRGEDKDTLHKFEIIVPKGIKYAMNLYFDRYYYFYKNAELIIILFDAKSNKLLNVKTDSIYNLNEDDVHGISAYYLDKFESRNDGFVYRFRERNIHRKKNFPYVFS